MDFMRDLPIRKIPGVGRVSERLLDAIGVKVRRTFTDNGLYFSHAPWRCHSH
jgi:nucleotidyltransferase/DNA polymerase involved in DNA repair